MTATPPVDGLALLRVPFAANQISKLPKPVKSRDDDKGKCERGSRYSADGHFCGGWHARSIHLDYVGHAALTDRLLDADPEWSWEPVAFGPDGLPQLDKIGGLWIRLTVCGVTRLGYGDAQGKTGPNAVKEAIGDALRNAAMRFGAALDLWHKGDLHADDTAPEPEPEPRKAPAKKQAAKKAAPPPPDEPLADEPPPADPDEPDWSGLDEQRFEELIDGASTATELNVIARDIAASAIKGAGRERLRRRFSAKARTFGDQK